jgi:DNA repair protein RadC
MGMMICEMIYIVGLEHIKSLSVIKINSQKIGTINRKEVHPSDLIKMHQGELMAALALSNLRPGQSPHSAHQEKPPSIIIKHYYTFLQRMDNLR